MRHSVITAVRSRRTTTRVAARGIAPYTSLLRLAVGSGIYAAGLAHAVSLLLHGLG